MFKVKQDWDPDERVGQVSNEKSETYRDRRRFCHDRKWSKVRRVFWGFHREIYLF